MSKLDQENPIMNEAQRCKEIKERIHTEINNLWLLERSLKGSRAEEYVRTAAKKLVSAWEDLVLAERLIK